MTIDNNPASPPAPAQEGLKPCPFGCNGVVHLHYREKMLYPYRATCDKCDCQRVAKTREEVIAAWNRRSGHRVEIDGDEAGLVKEAQEIAASMRMLKSFVVADLLDRLAAALAAQAQRIADRGQIIGYQAEQLAALQSRLTEAEAEVARLTDLNTRAFENYTRAEMHVATALAALKNATAVVEAARLLCDVSRTSNNLSEARGELQDALRDFDATQSPRPLSADNEGVKS